MATDVGYLDDLLLEVETTDDHFDKAIVRYEYPFVDGADLDDIGQKARTVRVRCYFWDEGGHETYTDHEKLIEYLKKREDFTLIHPVYGQMQGKVESVDIHHDDAENATVVDFAFVERFRSETVATVAVSAVDTAVEGSFLASQDDQGGNLATELAMAGFDISIDLDPAVAISAQLKGVSPSLRGFARQIDSALGWLNAQANEITQPLNSLIATVTFATNLPGRILGTVERCVERVARVYDVTANFPARFAAGVDFGMAKIQTDLDKFLPSDNSGAKKMMMRQVRLSCARRLALETAYIYADDQTARRTQKIPASAFDTLGRYIPRQVPDVTPMNVLELEQTLAIARTRLQSAVNESRDIQGLKDMALQLLQSVSGVKQGAENIVTVTIDTMLPLHLVCLRYGLPYSDAERLMAINPTVRNPTFVSGQANIYD